MPIQVAPSPPIWLIVSVLRSIVTAIRWQPTPPKAQEPSGTRVERLCGQPEQKYGVRCNCRRDGGTAFPPSASARSVQCPVSSRRARRDAIGARDDRRRQFAGRRQQPVAQRRRPLAGFVELADDARAHVFAPVVEHLLQLVLDDLALLLDDQDFFEAGGETPRSAGLERPRHADLVDAQAERRGRGLVDAQIVQGLAQIEPGLAAGHETEARIRAVTRPAGPGRWRARRPRRRRSCRPASGVPAPTAGRASGCARHRQAARNHRES